MPTRPPSPEMVKFASQFGGVLERDDDAPSGADIFFDPAYEYAVQLLDDFVGQKNAIGAVFNYDIQTFDNISPNAVCGLVEGRFCIGINLGLHLKLFELCSLVCNFYYLSDSEFGARIGDIANLGSKYKNILRHNNPQTQISYQAFLSSLVRRLNEEGHLDKFVFLSNLLLQFVIYHEVRHATDGHLHYFIEQRGGKKELIFLGEMESSLPENSTQISHLFELDADAGSFFAIASNLLGGRLSVVRSSLSDYERLRLLWVGSLLVANTWALAESEKAQPSLTHPSGFLRLLSLSKLPIRPDAVAAFGRVLSDSNPEKTMMQLYNDGAAFAEKIRICGEEFLPIFAMFTEDAFDHYKRIIYNRDAWAFGQQLLNMREKFIYRPKTLIDPAQKG